MFISSERSSSKNVDGKFVRQESTLPYKMKERTNERMNERRNKQTNQNFDQPFRCSNVYIMFTKSCCKLFAQNVYISSGLVQRLIKRMNWFKFKVAVEIFFSFCNIVKYLQKNFKDELVQLQSGDDNTLHLANDSMLWTPDLYIYNLKSINIR